MHTEYSNDRPRASTIKVIIIFFVSGNGYVVIQTIPKKEVINISEGRETQTIQRGMLK